MIGLNGGLLGVRKVPSLVTASGVWVPNEQSLAKQAGIWPLNKAVTRYYRFNNFAATSLNSNAIDLAEIRFYTGDTVITGITTTTSFSWDSGSAGALTDGNLADRSYYLSWSTAQPTATISFDFGSATLITHVEIYINYEVISGPRFPATFDMQSSSDGTSYTQYATVTKGTATVYSGVVDKTAKLAV